MSDRMCNRCENHYIGKGWWCWSGNKSLGFCRYNAEPHPLAKIYRHKQGASVSYRDVLRILKGGSDE